MDDGPLDQCLSPSLFKISAFLDLIYRRTIEPTIELLRLQEIDDDVRVNRSHQLNNVSNFIV